MTMIKKNMTVDLYVGEKTATHVVLTAKEMKEGLEYKCREYDDIPKQDKELIIDIARENIFKENENPCFVVWHDNTGKCTSIQYKGTVTYTDY